MVNENMDLPRTGAGHHRPEVVRSSWARFHETAMKTNWCRHSSAVEKYMSSG